MGNAVIYNVPEGTYQRRNTKERSLISPLNIGDYQVTWTDKFGDGIYKYGEYNGNVIVYLGDAASAAEVIVFTALGDTFFKGEGSKYKNYTLNFVVP